MMDVMNLISAANANFHWRAYYNIANRMQRENHSDQSIIDFIKKDVAETHRLKIESQKKAGFSMDTAGNMISTK